MAQAASLRPSKITVPKRCHPAAKIVFAEMRRQGITYDELEFRSGVLKSTFKAWRTHNKPGLESVQAVLGALGWEFLPIPRMENVPPAVAELIRKAAETWSDEDAVLCEVIAEIATSPRVERARLLASSAPVVPFPATRRQPARRKKTTHPDQTGLFSEAA